MARGFIEKNLNCGGEEWKENELCLKYLPYVQGNGEEPEDELMNKIMMTTDGERMVSFWTLLLGPLYFFYRKCYKQGVIYLLAGIAAAFIPVGTVILQLLAALYFYRMYVKQLDEWISDGSDPIEAGGTNKMLPIIIAAAFVVIAIVVSIGFLPLYRLLI